METKTEKVYISKIELTHYRNFTNFEQEFSDNPILIIGENGTGKTNILESISLLSQGRGLKYTKFDKICAQYNNGDVKDWSTNISFRNNIGLFSTKSVFHCGSNKRQVSLDDSKISVKELANFLNIIWITPELHHIFVGARSERLKFLDRITYSFYRQHGSLINQYDHYLNERRSLLKMGRYDKEWISVIEKSLSKLTVDICHNRSKVIEIINDMSPKISGQFPQTKLELESNCLNFINENQEESVSKIAEQFQINREIDLKTGKSNFGPQKTDLIATHLESNQKALYCSMGQQKAILVSIMLSQIFAMVEDSRRAPIILLDEVFVHLDKRRSEYLSELLFSTGSQVWVTDTEDKRLHSFAKKAQIIHL